MSVDVPATVASVEALRALYEGRFYRFLRLAEAIVGDPDQARDVVQETFARALRNRSSFRGDGSLEGWVWQILVNTARNSRTRRPQVIPLHLIERAAAIDAERERPDVRDVVGRLPERQRVAVFLRYYADLDYRRIAEALEVEVGTVGAMLSQAQRTLRRLIEEEEAR